MFSVLLLLLAVELSTFVHGCVPGPIQRFAGRPGDMPPNIRRLMGNPDFIELLKTHFTNDRNINTLLNVSGSGGDWTPPLVTGAPVKLGTNCGNMDQFRRGILDETNKLRKKHKSGALKDSPRLERMAEDWAVGQLPAVVGGAAPKHSQGIYGENIYWAPRGAKNLDNAAKAADLWYAEMADYDFKKGESKNGNPIGHFTQLVWRSSEQVGHGWAFSEDCDSVVLVAMYDPPGNVEGQYQQNVQPAHP